MSKEMRENMNKFKTLLKEGDKSLPIYNPYYGGEQNTETCPNCGEHDDIDLLGPKDYKRDEHGNYRRTLGYRCNSCKNIFSVDKG